MSRELGALSGLTPEAEGRTDMKRSGRILGGIGCAAMLAAGCADDDRPRISERGSFTSVYITNEGTPVSYRVPGHAVIDEVTLGEEGGRAVLRVAMTESIPTGDRAPLGIDVWLD